MELSMVTLLFCLISLSLSKREYASGNRLNDIPQYAWHGASKPYTIYPKYAFFKSFNTLTNNFKQCFCYLQTPTGVSIIQKINPRSENLERLVLYLYKNPTTGDIKFYLPNNEKQIMIPDLAFDEGDRLETSLPDSVQLIFARYPELVTERKNLDTPDIAQLLSEKVNKSVNIPSILDFVEPNNLANADDEEKLMNPKITLIPNHVILGIDGIKNPDINYDSNHDGNIDQPDLHLDPASLHVNKYKENEFVQSDQGHLNDITEHETEQPNLNMNLENKNLNSILEDEPNYFKIVEEPISEVTNDASIHLYQDPNVINEDVNSNSNYESYLERHDITSITENETDQSNLSLDSTPKEKYMKIKPDLTVDQMDERGENENQYKLGINEYPNYPIIWPEVGNDIQTPPFFNGIVKNKENPTLISLNIDKEIVNSVPYNQKIPIEPIRYSQKEIFYNKQMNPQDLSIIAIDPHELLTKYPESAEVNIQDTFDNWFNQQMKRVQFANSKASSFLDIYTFKYLIEKILHQRGMHITERGLLVDSEGNILQMANLGLRPILIGNSVEYKNFLQGKFSKFKLPIGMPYLEAIMITSINPPKVLGIIPLGKTYLPKSYRNPLSLYVEGEVPYSGWRCNNVKCKVVRKKAVPRRFRPINSKNYHEHYRPFHTTVSNNTPNSRRVLPFDQINTIIDRIYKEPLNEEKADVVTVPKAYVVNYNTHPLVTLQPSSKYQIGDTTVTPGFRIIGGNAATSSGTPLNSKGRSGFDPSDDGFIPDDFEE